MNRTRFYLPAHGGDFNPLSAAIVEITPNHANKLLSRKKRFEQAKEEDSDTLEHYYWDATPDWVGGWEYGEADEDDEPEPAEKEEAAEQIARQLDLTYLPHDRPTRIPMHVQFTFEPARTECDQCIVSESGVMWMCYPKHVDMEVRTDYVTWDEIEAVAIS